MRVVCLQVCWAAPVSPVLPRTTAPCCWRRRPGCCTWEAEERCTPSTPPTSPHLETSRWVSRRREPRHGHAMAAARHISQVFSRFSSADGGQTNNSLKQIEQNPIVFLQFYGYRIKRARRLFKGYWRESELSDAARTLSVCPSLFSLPVYIIHTLVFSPFLSIAPSIYLFFHLYLLSELSHPYPPPPHCLQIDWDASPEQKKQCLNKGRDNQVQVCSSSLFYRYYYYYSDTFSLRNTLKALFVCWVITGEHNETLLKAS